MPVPYACPMSDHRRPLFLGIETSCDDTAAALVDGDGRVVASVVSRQLAAHRPFGGVVPEIASREHLTNWPAVRDELFQRAGAGLDRVDGIAATRGPGLVGSLLVGLSLGKALAFGRGLPFYAVHHLHGHLYSPFLRTDEEAAEAAPEAFLGLVVSGGHTSLYSVEGPEVTPLAETRDDAMGEVFDKVGKRLGLLYPQGPRVDVLAERGDPARSPFSVPRCSDGSLDFSYSGLKSQALLAIEALERDGVPTVLGETEDDAVPEEVCHLLAGFREAAVEQILNRLERLFRKRRFPLLAVSGGAAANRLLRRRLPEWAAAAGVELRLVPLVYSGDNAAMIAHSALERFRRGDTAGDPLSVDAQSRLAIT